MNGGRDLNITNWNRSDDLPLLMPINALTKAFVAYMNDFALAKIPESKNRKTQTLMCKNV